MDEKTIKGTMVCRRRDAYGEIIVAEDGNTRSLYFGDGILQSTIRIGRPDVLVEDYSQAMMSALIFRDVLQSVLLVGLGGCSLVNFLLSACPGCSIDAVEVRHEVIGLARDFFLLQEEHARIEIFHAAGQDFIETRGAGTYDLILIDAFDENGPASPLLKKDFLTSCRARLNASGIFVMNAWNRPTDNFPALYASVKEVFGNNTLKLLLGEAYRNAVILGFHDSAACKNLPGYRPAARELQRRHQINFPKYLNYLYWQNSGGRE